MLEFRSNKLVTRVDAVGSPLVYSANGFARPARSVSRAGRKSIGRTDFATKDRRLSINDVARRAGVSPTTVSHSLSGKRPVATDTKDRILAVVAEMGFRPSEVARSLRTSRTNTVGLLIPDITNPFYPE